MLNTFLLLVLATALFTPPILLSKRGDRFTWPVRYFLSVFPVSYTFIGWQMAALGYGYFSCQGNPKWFHDCIGWGIDFTPLIEHGLFLMIPCVFLALPLTLILLLTTAVKQIAYWRMKNLPDKNVVGE
jgi:hypothetical protein